MQKPAARTSESESPPESAASADVLKFRGKSSQGPRKRQAIRHGHKLHALRQFDLERRRAEIREELRQGELERMQIFGLSTEERDHLRKLVDVESRERARRENNVERQRHRGVKAQEIRDEQLERLTGY